MMLTRVPEKFWRGSFFIFLKCSLYFYFSASEELTIAGMTFTTFDLGGHEQGKSEAAEWETPNEVNFLIPVMFSSHLEKNLPKSDTEK